MTTLKEFNSQIISKLKTILDVKFENIQYTSNISISPFSINQKLICKITSPESSHPSLEPSFTRVIISIIYNQNGKVNFNFEYPIDSVDCNFCTHPKESKKNISLGRKFNRKCIKYFDNTLKNKINKSFDLNVPQQVTEDIINQIGVQSESFKINSELFQIIQTTCPSKKLQNIKIKTGEPITFGSEYGFTKEKQTYYLNGKKVGTSKTISNFIRNNKELIIKDFNKKYPFTSKQNS